MSHAEQGWALAIHGGAGAITRGVLTTDQQRAYRTSLGAVAEAGAAVLRAGGSALDSVETAVGLLEDDPLFNAGRGAVFTSEGRNELDAAIMDGRTLAAGAVAGVTRTRHPISLARGVMENSPHVMLGGSGADAFSRQQGLEQVEPGWFFSEKRWRSLERFLHDNGLPLPARPVAGAQADDAGSLVHDEGKFGTVGAVACDNAGNVAAGTSTGGTTGKRWGRIGDSPIIGAGTYASNSACAVSATGTGEFLLRLAAARTICALVEYAGLTLQDAADRVIQQQLTGLGGDGGVITVARDGQVAFSFNSPGMYRASITATEALHVGLFGDEVRTRQSRSA